MPFKIKNWFFLKKNLTTNKKEKELSKNMLAEDYVNEGEKYANKNNLEESMRCFDAAINLDPKNDLALGDKALILEIFGKYEEALTFFSRALKINPANSITWHNKGLTFIRLNRLDEAIECFDKAIELKKDYAKAWYNKGRCLEMMSEIKKSQECLNIARKLDPFLFTKVKK
ncbi:MAG TPA: tetratricopeptide repeat protein [Nitrososphaeraceae archaeon]|nr:tetratricopeptide repeat protein [Nitrososphaeraceae archaeon]